MIHLIRASHANEFELQNYKGIKNLAVITSQHPLTKISLPTKKLWSPTDLPAFPYRRQLLNRLIGGEQWLFGLEKIINIYSVESIQRNIFHTAETYTPYTHQAVQLRKAGKIAKLVCTCWETIPHANEKFARMRQWKAEAYQYIDLFHTPTRRAQQALITEGVDPAKIVVIPYGVDLSRFRPLSLRGQSSQVKRKTILTVARLEKEKGMQDLEKVAQALPQYDFSVIGTGSYNPRGSNIQVKSVDYQNIHKEYQSADLFFLPSRATPTWEEQYGMCLVEAMACGLPIVTTTSGAIPEVVGNAGITHQVCDVDKMVTTIRQILTHPAQKKHLSKLSHERAKKYFDFRKVAHQLATLYR